MLDFLAWIRKLSEVFEMEFRNLLPLRDKVVHFGTKLSFFSISLKMQQIGSTSPPPELQMPIEYRLIWFRKAFGESIGSFRTYPELPTTISGKFQFRVFRHIFANFLHPVHFYSKCSRLAQLRRHQHCRWRSHIVWFAFWDVVGSPRRRSAFILTFLRSFLTILSFKFSALFSADPAQSSANSSANQRPARAKKVSAPITKVVARR